MTTTATSTHTFESYTFPSVQQSETISAYSWTVPNPQGAVFLLHGFRSHTRFNFLRNDSPESLYQYGATDSTDPFPLTPKTNTSLIRELNLRNLSVFGHDHVGHGSSTGLRSYFHSFQTLVDDLLQHIHLKILAHNKIPIFLCAHSMGGTTAIATALQHPSLIAGVALSSAATEPPANSFGFVGKIQYLLSGVTSLLIPTTVVVQMPKSDDGRLQMIFESDPLNSTIGIRSRVGRELIVAYNDIADSVKEMTVPFITASGENDTLVNPQAAKRFYERALSTDKKYFQADGRWHNLFAEDGCEDVWKEFADWIQERSSRINHPKSTL